METDELNGVYYPLYIKANEILKRFVPSRIFEAEYGWYNGHYSKDQSGQYVMDYFPIPVVSVKGFCDIEIGLGQITVSTKLKRKQVMSFSFDEFNNIPFEAYGVEDYLADYYSADLTFSQFRENVEKSKEKEIGFSFVFERDCDSGMLFDYVKLLRCRGFYY